MHHLSDVRQLLQLYPSQVAVMVALKPDLTAPSLSVSFNNEMTSSAQMRDIHVATVNV